MKKWMITMVVLALLAGSAFLLAGCRSSSAAAPQATPTLPAVKAGSSVVASAKVVPVRGAELSLPSGGSVTEVLVAEGDRVEAGQVLVRLDAARQAAAVKQAEAGLARAQATLTQFKAGPREEEVASARAGLAAAQAGLQKLQDGASPEAIEVSQAGLRTAQAELTRAQKGASDAQLVTAKTNMEKAARALQQAQWAYDLLNSYNPAGIGASPQALQLEQATLDYQAAKAQYDDLAAGPDQADVNVARAQVAQAQASLAQAKAAPRPADLAAAQAEVARAQAQLDLLLAGSRPEQIAAAEADVTSAEAGLAQAQAALTDMELHAPFAGTVASVDVKVGEQVVPGNIIVRLADLSAWQIETDDLTELNVVRIHEGDPATITFDALPDLSLPGTVTRINQFGQNKQGDIDYTVTITPSQNDERLHWNMTASVSIEPQR